MKSAVYLTVNGINRFIAVPVYVGADYTYLTADELSEVRNITGLNVPLGIYINARCLIHYLHILRCLYNLVKLMPACFHVHTSYFKSDNDVTLFDKGIIKIRAVHSCINSGIYGTHWRGKPSNA